MTSLPGSPDALRRWRVEVRRALPHAAPDLVEEVAAHLADRWLRARNDGMPDHAADALVAADLAQWRRAEAAPRRWFEAAGAWVSGCTADLRYAWRSALLRPGHAMAGVLLTMLAVTASVTSFAIAYGVLWRPLPYPEAERLAVLWQVWRGNQGQISYPDFTDLAGIPLFDSAAALGGGRGSLRIGDRIERVNVLEMEPRGYAMLGATPVAGRLLHAGDGGQPTAMISDRLWRTQFNRDATVIGRVLWLSGRDVTVVGVAHPGFDLELPITATLKLQQHDVFMVFDRSSPLASRRDASTYEALVRLAPGTSLEEAQAAVDAVGARLARAYPGSNDGRGFRLVPLHAQVVEAARRPLLLLLAAGLATLAIALANLSTLTLLRLTQRQPELAIRVALGAAAGRLRRLLFIEHLLSVAAGTAAGFALASWVVKRAVAEEASHLPRVDAMAMDAPVQLFAVATALLMTVVLSALPLLASRRDLRLRTGDRVAGRTRARVRRGLVCTELALAVALSAGGILYALSLARLFTTDPGFVPDGVVSVRVSAYAARYPAVEHVEAFLQSVIARINATPGLRGAAAGSSLPLSGQTTGTGVVARGAPATPASRQVAGWQCVTPGYLETLSMAIRKGRGFTADDRRQGGHVSIVNEALARALFGDADPIGRWIASGDGDTTGDWHQVVGVVGDVRHHALDTAPAPRLYDLVGEHWGRTFYVVARGAADRPAAYIGAVRSAVAAVDVEAPVFEAATMDALVARSAAPHRLAASLAGGAAAIGLLLAVIGVCAVSSASYAERRREVGVRAALGAGPRQLAQLVLGEALITAAVGVISGLALSALAAKLFTIQLYGVAPADVRTAIAGSVVVMLGAALTAAWPAAREASQADPRRVLSGD